MIYREVLPTLQLQPFIKNYLLVGFDNSMPPEFATKPYPTRVEQSLNFFAKGYIKNHNPFTNKIEKIAPTAIFGQQIGRLNFETCTTPEFLMLMVVFKEGAMNRLLGIPSNELTTQFCDAEPLFGAELVQVNDLIANAKNEEEMVGIAEEFLLKKVNSVKKDSNGIDRIGELLMANPNKFSLDWLADQACLSPRQFERRFSERMGVGPKLFSRINRFYQTFMYKETFPNADWLTIAIHFGYNDYAHLSKDFKQFGHVTPNILINQYSRRPEIKMNINF